METTNDQTFPHEEETSQSNDVNAEVLNYAGFWLRFWAFFIDGIVVFSLNGILVYPILRLTGFIHQEIWVFTVLGIMTTVVSFVYFTVMTKFFQQTIGKMILGVKVMSEQGPLTWQTVIFREVIGRYIHQAFFILQFLYLFVAFSPKKQGVHDHFADTVVIIEKR
ncbi:RDD family protein [Alkalihalobacillus sp. LMS39]|uniref:RDD family protein n=1 Tax=Alkalihalobacillus sp. LMS39 TaxID=2924032 RepID=UPI001FB4B9B2|nr:RDD family protein [Alkalihalobacillus sp. LMS39]UOE93451.1 RDD family protein [Alkalihalobacillus sp. LMS39]